MLNQKIISKLSALGLLTLVVVGLAAFGSMNTKAQSGSETYKVDTGHSNVIFKIQHMGISNFYGMFLGYEGEYETNSAQELQSINIVVKTDSIFTANQKRDQHLKAPDYFNAAQYPEIKFTSTSVEKTGDKTYKVTGTLEFMGRTKTVVADAVHTGTTDQRGFRTGYEATFTFDRTEFMKKTRGLGDDVTLVVSVQGIRQ